MRYRWVRPRRERGWKTTMTVLSVSPDTVQTGKGPAGGLAQGAGLADRDRRPAHADARLRRRGPDAVHAAHHAGGGRGRAPVLGGGPASAARSRSRRRRVVQGEPGHGDGVRDRRSTAPAEARSREWVDQLLPSVAGRGARRAVFARDMGSAAGPRARPRALRPDHAGGTTEVLTDPAWAVPVEINVVRDGALVSHSVLSYERIRAPVSSAGACAASSCMSPESGDRAVVDFELANIRLDRAEDCDDRRAWIRRPRRSSGRPSHRSRAAAQDPPLVLVHGFRSNGPTWVDARAASTPAGRHRCNPTVGWQARSRRRPRSCRASCRALPACRSSSATATAASSPASGARRGSSGAADTEQAQPGGAHRQQRDRLGDLQREHRHRPAERPGQFAESQRRIASGSAGDSGRDGLRGRTVSTGVAALAAAGIDIRAPVFSQEQVGSAYMQSLNSAGNLAREAAADAEPGRDRHLGVRLPPRRRVPRLSPDNADHFRVAL